MKHTLLRILALILILASLLPLAAACTKDPPPNDDDDDGGGENVEESTVISANINQWNEMLLVDFESEKMADLNKNFKTNQVYNAELDKTVYKWDLNTGKNLTFAIGKSMDIFSYQYIEFKIYSPAKSSGSVVVKLGEAGNETVKLNFKGWKTIRLRTDAFGVARPFPTISAVDFYCSLENVVLYITDVKAVTPVYTLEVPSTVDINDPAIYNYIIDRYVAYEMGLPEQGVNPTSERHARVAYIDDVCRRAIIKFNDTYNNPDVAGLFGNDIDMRNGLPDSGDTLGLAVRSTYTQINGLARAYACYGGTYYKNPDVLNKIKLSLEYAYERSYGVPILENGRTVGDWYNWQIATPDHLIATLCLIRDELTQAEINKYLEPYLKLVPYPYGTASNLLHFSKLQLLAGALLKDPYRIVNASVCASDAYIYIDDAMQGEVIVPTTDGFYSDGSFIQHDTIAYTGGYGMGILGNTASLLYLTAGSVFEPQEKSVNNHYEWVLNSFAPVIYGKNFMTTLNGRGTSIETEAENTKLLIKHTLTILDYAPNDVKERLKSYVKAMQIIFNDDFGSSAPMHMIDFCINLKADETVVPATTLEAVFVFGAMDRVVQHTPKYGVCVAMSSTRIAKYESINTQNEAAWYQGDGMIYIYTDGYDYNKYYMYFANPYLMPGTTVNTAERKYQCLSPALLGGSAFSGGVEQGNYGISCFELSYVPNTAYGSNTFKNINDTKISAKKSYFMFDNEIVCIGTDIYDESGKDVLTVVENRLWRNGDVLSINGQAVDVSSIVSSTNTPDAPETTVNARTMHFTNMGGYVFLRTDENGIDKDGNVLSYNKVTKSFIQDGWSQYMSNNEYNQLTSTTRDFLEIAFNHGTGNGDKYAYVYLPEATVAQTEEYDDVELLKISSDTHAVLEKTLGSVGCVFFEDKEQTLEIKNKSDYTDVTSVSTLSSCAVMITKTVDGEYVISVSDPSQTLNNISINVSITGISTVVSADERINASVSDGVLVFTANVKSLIGQTLSVTVK